jgi:hypothetical protein
VSARTHARTCSTAESVDDSSRVTHRRRLCCPVLNSTDEYHAHLPDLCKQHELAGVFFFFPNHRPPRRGHSNCQYLHAFHLSQDDTHSAHARRTHTHTPARPALPCPAPPRPAPPLYTLHTHACFAITSPSFAIACCSTVDLTGLACAAQAA